MKKEVLDTAVAPKGSPDKDALSTQKDSQIKIFPFVVDKCVVDMVNGIDVANDQIQVQQRRNASISSRVMDSLSGRGSQRQNEINNCFSESFSGILSWLDNMSESLTLSFHATQQINQRVTMIRDDVYRSAKLSSENRFIIEALAEEFQNRCDRLSHEIERVDLEQRAERQLGQVFNKWKAGHFNMFSFAGRCYAALDELSWGEFGDYCRRFNQDHRTRQNFLQDLKNRLIIQLIEDSGKRDRSARFDINFWLEMPDQKSVSMDDLGTLAYMADCYTSDNHPFVFSATQNPDNLPIQLPRLSSSERVSERMLHEIFELNN